ncbi:phosphate transporter subunit; ATP-binding component of ABC superfamily [Magnetospirillum sp. XM-1]|uniref:phosphate ABC transporter ATP-binding protein n=1 Tax=Magnetospirillum sp. XM-1 TaxID=1663591 RepID=UPI00073E085F|nr:phosphate ABC transporter ATP-binding protein [Magnetospirillum sp. XM-1]CUW38005.1 phosphate transporter subunit; ATP-binding component of ABC superfamily [Magnetospirillum sp. XM-1]
MTKDIMRADDQPLRSDLVPPSRPPASDGTIIEVAGMVASYHGKQVLHDVFAHFPERTVTAIMGPSGCGKSTLLRTLNRTFELHPGAVIHSGTVALRGTDIYAPGCDPMEIRRRVGIVHQRPVLFPMSIIENVLFGPRYHGGIPGTGMRAFAEGLLAKVGLLEEVRDRLDDPASRLSGGQQQRLCIARSLANAPEVLLMDEPCSTIDPIATGRIEQLIGDLAGEYTIIVVTHNTQQAKRISRQTIFMFDGRVVEAGPTDHLFAHPTTELAKVFVSGAIG